MKKTINYQLSTNMTRGQRNNNPLNIRHSADKWQGARVEQTDKSFVQFESMAYGYRAAWKVLDTYWTRFEKERIPYTVRNIIARWAPPAENDTEAYIRAVIKLSGLGGNECMARPLRFWYLSDLERTARLLAAMACVECGLKMEEVNMDEVWQGYDLAFPKAGRRKRLREEKEALRMKDEYWDWSPAAFDEV